MTKKIKLDFSAPKILHLDFTPRVYLANKTRTYILLRDGTKGGFFLTMKEGSVEVVRIPKEDGEYRLYKLNEGEVSDKDVKRIYYPLHPTEHDLLHAAKVYWDSTLSKSHKAERELRVILGLPMSTRVEDEPEDQKPDKRRKKTVSTQTGTGASGALDLMGICEELGLEPGKARKLLRGHMEKPQGGWKWDSLEKATEVKELMKSLL